jgi:NADH dehydrogenase
VHVEAAQRVAAQAHGAGAERLVHVSGIGADATSQSRYIRKRGEGELVVRAAFPDAIIIRPAVMFGPDDAFLTTVLKLLRRLPIYPLFGRGLTRLQPAYVEDVAEAIGRVMQRGETPSMIFELGGPRVYSYEEFLRAVAHQAGASPVLIPIPFAVWYALAWACEILPNPPLTRNQVELMQVDTVSAPELPGFAELEISPRSVEVMLQEILSSCD